MRSVLWALVYMLGSCMLQPALLSQSASADRRRWQDRLKGYPAHEVVIPQRVDKDGHPLPPHDHFQRRTKRSLDDFDSAAWTQAPSPGVPSSSGGHSSGLGDSGSRSRVTPHHRRRHGHGEKYYTLEAFGHKFDLLLSPDSSFIAPGVVVQYVDTNETRIQEGSDAVDKECFHSGRVVGDPDSVVQLSICHSLMGSIRAFGEFFLIEPHLAPNFSPDLMSSIAAREATNDSATDAPAWPPPEEEWRPEWRKAHIMYKLNGEPPQGRERDANSCGNEDRSRGEPHAQSAGSSDRTGGAPHQESSEYGAPKRRSKRSESVQRYVEVMVVADDKMKNYHGGGLQHYILILMSIVNGIYRDPSAGNAINIVVVKLIELQSQEAGPRISSNAAETLRSFCKWQHQKNNPDDASQYHHDTAVLLTRQNICSSATKCDTLGLAELGTMCMPDKSCSIIEDNGLSAAYTIAHEVGHVFNLPHDDDRVCKDRYDANFKGEVLYVMSPTLDHKSKPWTWSACSRRVLTEFIDNREAECLRDQPLATKLQHKMMLLSKDLQPGQYYGPDKQCQQVYGPGYKHCPYTPKGEPPCMRLWCTDSTEYGCRTNHMPWAEGTKCEPGRWCFRGNCTDVVYRPSQKGGWGDWGPWGQCSLPCGGGISQSLRQCDNPKPANGGQYCIGTRVRYRTCNRQECSKDVVDTRAQQCQKFNGRHFNINGLNSEVKWVPKYAGVPIKDQCKLICRVANNSAYYTLSNKVIFGTKCGPDTSDMCISGKCVRAGCDNVLSSDKRRDRCGICGGDNSTCQEMSANVRKSVEYGYNFVVTIPKGSANIKVTQRSHTNEKEDNNYLALQNRKREYILNGGLIVSMFRKEVAVGNKGSMIEYSGSDNIVEVINATRPLDEDIHIYVLSVGSLTPPYIHYEYTAKHEALTRYIWQYKGRWSHCDRKCRGTKRRQAVCMLEHTSTRVDRRRCTTPQPQPQEKRCHTKCQVSWRSEQGECSSHCGVGVARIKTYCEWRSSDRNRKVRRVNNRHCSAVEARPATSRPCNGLCSPASWAFGDWTPCSASCGIGVQTRSAKCLDEYGHEWPTDCSHSPGVMSRTCDLGPCPQWRHGAWSSCSGSCGYGTKVRAVLCHSPGAVRLDEADCGSRSKPDTIMRCQLLWPCSTSTTSTTTTTTIATTSTATRTTSAAKTSTSGATTPAEVPPTRHHRPPLAQPRVLSRGYPSPSLTPSPAAPASPSFPSGFGPTWRTGGWTECSRTCGEGSRQRYVSCRDRDGNIATESECFNIPKPPSTETCSLRGCGQWRTGNWAECSRTCGEGSQTRFVACVTLDDLEEQMAEPAQCDVSVKPATDIACNIRDCISESEYDVISISTNRVERTAHWRAGPWTQCSESCNSGWRRRRVVCQDERGASDDCTPDDKPDDMERCNAFPCPSWNTGGWGLCSATCGLGNKHRVVICQMQNGTKLSDDRCDVTNKPADAQQCLLRDCPEPTPTRWHRGAWSQCSVTCGRGQRTRRVQCVNEGGEKVEDVHCTRRKPRVHKRCKQDLCPRWTTSRWGKCSVSCGAGVRARKVQCIRSKNHRVNETLCEGTPTPATTEPCQLSPCRPFYWKTGRWSQCSSSCGLGAMQRRVTCADATTHRPTDARRCDGVERPRARRRCSREPCSEMWVTGKWGQCTVSCGDGRQMRHVACQALTPEGWLQQGETNSCSARDKPVNVRLCNYGDCGALHRWTMSEWSPCSRSCGFGRVTRNVHCVDVSTNQIQPKKYCLSLFEPDSSKMCYMGPCYSSTCKELRRIASVRTDGEYNLSIQGQLRKVYCHGMKRPRPTEYLTLSTGEEENYSEIYAKRLRHPNTCPFNGTRLDECVDCFKTNSFKRAGLTAFSKIRFNTTSLAVIVDDFTHSSTAFGRRVPLASAGDCYSSSHVCPQGTFHVNLSGTGFRVSMDSKWMNTGYKTTRKVMITEAGERVAGTCGGHCGQCQPDGIAGLMLQLQP